jgi:hypothetical protein
VGKTKTRSYCEDDIRKSSQQAFESARENATKAAHRPAWVIWERVCETLKVPTEIVTSREGEAELTRLRIRAYLYDCIVVNKPKLLPSTAEKYLQNLIAVFGGLDEKEDATKRTVAQFYKRTLQEPNQKMIIIGYHKAHAARKPAWMSKKIPIKAEWIKELQRIGVQKVQHSLCDLKLSHPVGYELAGRRVHLAIAIGFYFLCRKSEYLPGMNPHVSWCVAWEGVSFYDATGKELEWYNVAENKVQVDAVSLHIQNSKTDAKGIGRTPSMKRMNVAGHYCVVNELVDYF